ncbi:hypothetical protein Tdes44962_MAKER06717 [Teratosphaeria destructans]|uniref:Uncharacterized protein n=1 Tax=Teratosphaeria destructans TaxID=418781 RepID=A0A9W7W7A5_9PEZI|nr:hypothetical protein Tdes44962_MAKER06717 [Teratosphaeria destructans]
MCAASWLEDELNRCLHLTLLTPQLGILDSSFAASAIVTLDALTIATAAKAAHTITTHFGPMMT